MPKLTKIEIAERDEAIAKLRKLLPVGSTVKTETVHVSKSGMMRVIRCFTVDGDEITWLVARATTSKMHADHYGIKVGGAGMDMGFALIYGLSRTLYPNGHPCTGSDGTDTYHADEIRKALDGTDDPGHEHSGTVTVKFYGPHRESKHIEVPVSVVEAWTHTPGLDPYRCPSNDHTNDFNAYSRKFEDEHGTLPSTGETREEWCAGRSAYWHASVSERYSPTRIHSDGGYAVSQAWM